LAPIDALRPVKKSGSYRPRGTARLKAPTISPMESLTQYYRVDRREIAYIKFVIESYDGVGLLSTVEPQSGLIVVRIPPGCEKLIDDIISDLKKTILIEPAAQPS